MKEVIYEWRTLAIVVVVVLCVVALPMSCVALTVLIPDHVIAALNALPPRDDVHPDYFFWSGNSKHKSLTGRWQRKLERLNDYLSIAKDDGTPMRFHSHQLRGTFAITQLLSGTSMQDLSKVLAQIGKDYGKVLLAVGS